MTLQNLSSNEPVFIGIDPGIKGFFCIMYGEFMEFYPMPNRQELNKSGKGKKTVLDYPTLIKIVLEIRQKYANFDIHVAIEDVHALQGSASGATFEFGRAVGAQNLAIMLIGAKTIQRYSPKRWQADIWLGHNVIKIPSSSGKTMITDTKATSEGVALKLFPDIDFRKSNRSRKNDDNKIDSLLICEYLKRNYEKGKIQSPES